MAALVLVAGGGLVLWQAGFLRALTHVGRGNGGPDVGGLALVPGQAWVSVSNGRLVYGADGRGNRVPDFSQVGYHGGDASIPDVPVLATLHADAAGDDTARIQAALDAAARAGRPGAVVLASGSYRLAGTVGISGTGVVLRGAGSASGGTLLVAVGKPHTLVKIGGSGKPAREGASHAVTDAYVPVGATTVHLDSAADLRPGDRVIVERPFEANWIHDIGMDRVPPRPGGKPSTQWKPNAGLQLQRTLTAVHGDTIQLDVPLTSALEKQYTHATVWKYLFPGRVTEAGLEHLAADGAAFDTDPGWHDSGYFASTLVATSATENSWVRDVMAHHFGQAFTIGEGSLRVSVVDTASLDVSVPQDINAQPVAYTISGQLSLIAGCRATGSNFHAWATQAQVPGPNVFTRCTASNTGKRKLDAGPHQRWAVGTLYDALTLEGSLELGDRQWMGSGQGWAGANSVLWNCKVSRYQVQEPPTAHNWAIGCTGTLTAPAPEHRPGQISGAVGPDSLYEAQLTQRHAG
jgi:hypothetical protein